MRRRLVAVGAALAVGIMVATAAALGGRARAKPPRLTVFAAASLTNVFPRIDRRERYSFGGSNLLAAQIEQGLPADVFASADTSLPRRLHHRGLVTKPVSFTSNRLVLVVARGDPLHLHAVRDLERPGVKVVMAAAGVPVGDYTRTCLRRLGLANLVRKAASQETDVREVLAKVALGEADAGFVYSTDARTVADEVTVLRLPARAQPRVLYAAAAVRSSPHLEAAEAWVRRLLSRRSQRRMRAAGFLPLPHR